MAGIPGAGCGGGHPERVGRPRRGAVVGGTRAAAPSAGSGGSGGRGAEAAQGGGPAAGGGAQARGCVGRFHRDSIPEREPKPGFMSAYEESLKRYADKWSDIVIRPSIGMSFDSLAEAYEFYNLYSWEVGFGIRWNDSTKNADKSVMVQEIVCNCEGKPEMSNTASVRTDCKARIQLHKFNDNGWYILQFQGDHNHPLSGTCSENSIWPSHKHLEPYTKDMVCCLRDNNVDLSKMRCIIHSFFGAMKKVIFNKWVLKSLCQTITMELPEDEDVCKTMELFDDFSSLRRDDPSFQFRVELDDNKRLFKTVLWTNGRSRMQYAHFGDAITFDTTYRSKLYDMPFGLFVGVNNHYQSVILGGVLMQHETVESFKWVFREFITLMGGKAPSIILTGQCHAMEAAIQEVLPDTTHKWCKVHMLSEKNEFLGSICSKSGFMDDFQKITDSMLTVREFESAWQHLLDKYNLHGNAFLSQIYDSRHKWAKPYFKEKFCAKQTSMQRNECADHIFKGYVPLNRSINMFVRYYNKILSDLDSKESFEEKRSRKRSRVMSKGVPVEEHAAKIYTRAMFEKFVDIIFQSGSYMVDEKERGKAYLARHIRSDCRESWSQVEFEVNIRAEDGAVVCECGLGEHMGMPCCHAVKVMIHLGMLEIPAGNIVKRWTMDARDVLPPYSIQHESDKAAENSQSYRRSELFISAMEFVKAASRSDQTFDVGFACLVQMEQELWEHEQVKDVSELSEKCNRSAAQGSDMQGISAAAKDDATSAAQKRRTEAEAPDLKPKTLQSVQHTQSNGP
ncbi:unnamed protein product [Urochloa decumbens]|uniref:Protein FAR1-RELATED SEQUENCE n=1 Tax=Urochloa decumbens TaxID=240449 RepID=A0ABC9H8I9_9POAL